MTDRTDKEKLKEIRSEKKREQKALRKSRFSGRILRMIIVARVLAVIWLLFALYIYIRVDSFVGPALVSGTIVLYIALIIYGFLAGKSLKCSITAPDRTEKNKECGASLRIANMSWLPVARGYVAVYSENSLTGEEEQAEIPFSISGHGETVQHIDIESRYCGRVRLFTETALVMDPLALKSSKRALKSEALLYVMPATTDITTDDESREALDMESFKYSQTRKGSDVSETYAIRDYQPGDSIKKIHWKLTYKTGDVMVRESSYPIYNSMLILIETGFSSKEDLRPEWMSTMTEAAISVAAALTAKSVTYEIGIFDNGEGKYRQKRIESEDDLWAASAMILGAKRAVSPADAVTHFLENFSGQPFAHMIYVTAGSTSPDLAGIAGESVVTVLRCGGNTEENSPVAEYGFRPESWAADLEYIRV